MTKDMISLKGIVTRLRERGIHAELCRRTKTVAREREALSYETAFHSENVANYALKIAKEMKLPKMKQEAIYLDGLIHDIGKIGIKENILTKPAKLTEEEYRSIKEHPNIGFQMI